MALVIMELEDETIVDFDNMSKKRAAVLCMRLVGELVATGELTIEEIEAEFLDTTAKEDGQDG